MPLAALVGVVLVWIARTIDPVLRRRLIFAGVLFFLGAVGVESIGGMLESNKFNLESSAQFLLFNLSMLVEESLELAGAIVAFWATLAYLQVVRGPDGLTVSVRDSAS